MNMGPSMANSVCLARLGGVGALPAASAAAEGLTNSGILAGSGGLGGATVTVSFMANAAAAAAVSAALRASSAADAAARAEAASALAASNDSCTAACVFV